MNTGLYFGSFNPIHIGHLAIANYILEYSALDQIWFVVSPHNPLKEKKSLLKGYHRLEMVDLAIGDDDRMRSCDIEFGMPTPSYTIDTLTYLREKHPGQSFQLIMGADSLRSFHKWKNAGSIVRSCPRIIYPRPGASTSADQLPLISLENTVIVDAPLIEISSSFIRDAIRDGKDIRHFMPAASYRYMREMHFYE
ncbi:MAG: nicotinic acid mononucleotide adenylyltransferase [Bacteroidetes bacterium]|nr:MAG: nicotinic acid mononucleotide adenylyltransferase [Bacteroidota bacterium]